MDGESEIWLDTPDLFRAMAHPLRMKMLGSLRLDGPATAAMMARRFGTDSGQTSHHLRHLARVGFIVEAPELGRGARGRERWWKAAHRSTRWGRGDGAGSPPVREMEEAARQVWDDLLDDYRAETDRGEWSEDWQDAASSGDLTVRTTPEGLKALRDEMAALVDKHESDAETSETVIVILHAFPRKALP